MLRAMPGLKERAKTIPQILEMAQLSHRRPPLRHRMRPPRRSLASVPAGMLGQIDFASAKC